MQYEYLNEKNICIYLNFDKKTLIARKSQNISLFYQGVDALLGILHKLYFIVYRSLRKTDTVCETQTNMMGLGIYCEILKSSLQGQSGSSILTVYLCRKTFYNYQFGKAVF